LANVLGGLALIGLLGWMLSRRAENGSRNALLAVFTVVLALQAAGGALISARLAGAACAKPCEHVWLPGAAALWDPGRAGNAVDLLGNPIGGQPLYAVHALLGMALLPTAFAVAVAHRNRAARHLLLAVGAAVAAGLMLYVLESPLLVAVLHAVLIGVVIITVAALAAAHGRVSMESTR
jgi:heme A synthase